MTGKYKRLRSGKWGAMVFAAAVRPGDPFDIVCKSGKKDPGTVGEVLWQGPDAAIVTLAPKCSRRARASMLEPVGLYRHRSEATPRTPSAMGAPVGTGAKPVWCRDW